MSNCHRFFKHHFQTVFSLEPLFVDLIKGPDSRGLGSEPGVLLNHEKIRPEALTDLVKWLIS